MQFLASYPVHLLPAELLEDGRCICCILVDMIVLGRGNVVTIPTANDIGEEDEPILGRIFTVAAKIAKEAGIAEDGYRLIMNCNTHGGQEVYHIHLHLLGGRPLGPMLSR